jgi:hypothetical protein
MKIATRRLSAILFGFTAAACGSGGGGGGEPPTDEGSFTVADFAYSDPRSADFQLLSAQGMKVADRDEVLSLLLGSTREALYLDDEQAGHAVQPTFLFSGALSFDFDVKAGAAGDLDGVPGDELVLVGNVPGTGQVTCLSRASGDFEELNSFSLAALGFGPLVSQEPKLELADLDRDGRNEVLVSLGDNDLACVFDYDPLLGFSPSLVVTVHASFEGLTLVSGNFDDDLELELLAYVAFPFQPVQYRFFDGPANGHASLSGWRVLPSVMSGAIGLRLNFDRQPDDEVAFVSGGMSVYEVGPGFQLDLAYADHISGGGSATAAAALDFDGDNVEELVAVFAEEFSPTFRLEHRASPDSKNDWDSTPESIDLSGVGSLFLETHFSLATADGDADGRRELFVQRAGNEPTILRVEIDGAPVSGLTSSVVRNLQEWEPEAALVTGDFDADSMLVRFRDHKFLTVADPIPLVLLAAPPTKAGISQNYDGTSTSYGHSIANETSSEVSDGLALSIDVGVEHKFKLVEASFKVKFGFEYTKTTGKSTSTTITKTYSGGSDADVLVFEGILYQRYEYEVVSAGDPDLIGEIITLDEPVARRIYKWTLPYYESILPANHHLSSLLVGTKGDPASYRNEAEANAVAAVNRAWLPDAATVGQGTGAVEVELTLETGNSTSEERKYSLGLEAGFKIGPASATIGLAWTHSDVVEVSTTLGDSFAGAVGDIQDPNDYSDWAYDFGLLVYRRDLDPAGNTLPGFVPLWVIDYWTRPFGAGY